MNISPTTNISAQPLKKALHKNPEMQYPGTVGMEDGGYGRFTDFFRIRQNSEIFILKIKTSTIKSEKNISIYQTIHSTSFI